MKQQSYFWHLGGAVEWVPWAWLARLVGNSLYTALGVATAVIVSYRPAFAETLAEAIAMAYQFNPTLQSQRAELQATDEDYVQARAGFRPTVSAQASSTYSKTPQESLFGGRVETEANQGDAELSVNQPLYTGGRVTAEVRAAEAGIRAGREQLRSVESNVLFAAIQAYCDVRRDRAALVIQLRSLEALNDAVKEIRARYDAGANTITDVSQAEAQLEAARALVTSAQAQLEVSAAAYISSIGQSPGELAPPPPLADLPSTIDNAFDIAERESPSIRQAQFADAVSQARIQEAKAARRPTVTLSGTLGYSGTVAPFASRDYDRAVSVTATINQPIFTGGLTASQIRQATDQESAARIQVDLARRTAVQSVSQAWSQHRAAAQNFVTAQSEVRASQAAFDGMRVEYRAGLRGTLDVLIAQETLRDAQITANQTQHDAYLSEASLLGAVGRLEARVIVQGLPLYQPQVSLRRVENVGSTPWDVIPAVLDKIAAPAPFEPTELPATSPPIGSVRMSPVSADAAIQTEP